jgi:chromosome partitioning protein
MKAVISVVNVAARSGKTTVAVNLAAEFAARGLRTLLVDADPQARATPFLMKPDEVVGTLSDVLLTQPSRVTRRPAPVWDVFSPASLPHLGVVAGGIGLAAFDELDPARAADLGARLASISDFHDVAILDTPSSLALLTRACLRASTHVIAPVSPDTQGEEGLRLIAECIGSVTRGGEVPPVLWVVCNRFDCRDRSSGLLYERLRAEWGGKVLETIVHRDEQVEGCAERRQPVRALAPTSAAATLYARLADEVLARLRDYTLDAGG